MRIVRGKKLRILILLAFFLLVFSRSQSTWLHQDLVFAAEKKDKTVTAVQDADTLRKELSLVLPSILENPSYKVVFKNPSSQPIELSIDGKTYKNIKSPFSLPNLSVGKHTLVFKYTNKQGVLKILTTEILIVPRKPIIDSKQRKIFENPEPVIISGTAIPNGKILMVADGKTVQQIDVDSSGTWVVKLEQMQAGHHTFMFFATIDGIINPTPVILDLEYKDKLFGTPTSKVNPAPENFGERIYKRLKSVYWDYKDMFVYVLGALLAIGFTLFLLLVKKHLKEKEQEKTLAELLNLDDGDIIEVLEKNKKRKSPKIKSHKKPERKETSTKAKINRTTVKPSYQSKKKSKKNGVSSKIVSKASKSDNDTLELSSSKSIHVEKIKVALPKKGKKVLSKEEFLKRFKKEG